MLMYGFIDYLFLMMYGLYMIGPFIDWLIRGPSKVGECPSFLIKLKVACSTGYVKRHLLDFLQ